MVCGTESSKLALIEDFTFDPFLKSLIQKMTIKMKSIVADAKDKEAKLSIEKAVEESKIDRAVSVSAEEDGEGVDVLEARSGALEVALAEAKTAATELKRAKDALCSSTQREDSLKAKIEEKRKLLLSSEEKASHEAKIEQHVETLARCKIAKQNREEELDAIVKRIGELKEYKYSKEKKADVLSKYEAQKRYQAIASRYNAENGVPERLAVLRARREELLPILGEEAKVKVLKEFSCPSCLTKVGLTLASDALIPMDEGVSVVSNTKSVKPELDAIARSIDELTPLKELYSPQKLAKQTERVEKNRMYEQAEKRRGELEEATVDVQEISSEQHAAIEGERMKLVAALERHRDASTLLNELDDRLGAAIEERDAARRARDAFPEDAEHRVGKVEEALGATRAAFGLAVRRNEVRRQEAVVAEIEGRLQRVIERHRYAKELKAMVKECRTIYMNKVVQRFTDDVSRYTDELFTKYPITVRFGVVKQQKKKSASSIQLTMTILYKGIEYPDVGVLSGGEKTRLSLAITLAMNRGLESPFVLLDESINSVEPDLRADIIELLTKYAHVEGKSVCMVSHMEPHGLFDAHISL